MLNIGIFLYQLAIRTTVGKVAFIIPVSETSRAGHSIFTQELMEFLNTD